MAFRRGRTSWRSGACLFAAGVFVAGCQAPIIYHCQEDSDCVEADGGTGICEVSAGFCSFPDPTCPSGRRFSKHAGDGLSGDCADSPDEPASTSSTSASTWPEPASTAASTETEAGDSASGSSGPAGSATDSCALEQIIIVASIAECTDPVNNDPAVCEAYAGDGLMTVDIAAMDLDGVPFTSFLAFELDPVTAVESAWVELNVGPGASSESSGELWEVGKFSLQDLSQGQPEKIGDVPAVFDLGAVVDGDTPRFRLPPSLLEGATSLYLGLFPLSSDGIQYENLRSDPSRHPRLVVERCAG